MRNIMWCYMYHVGVQHILEQYCNKWPSIQHSQQLYRLKLCDSPLMLLLPFGIKVESSSSSCGFVVMNIYLYYMGIVFVITIMVMTHQTVLTFMICPHCSLASTVQGLCAFVFCSQPLVTSSTLCSNVLPCSFSCTCLQHNASVLA